jgi:hypothetical protein
VALGSSSLTRYRPALIGPCLATSTKLPLVKLRWMVVVAGRVVRQWWRAWWRQQRRQLQPTQVVVVVVVL